MQFDIVQGIETSSDPQNNNTGSQNVNISPEEIILAIPDQGCLEEDQSNVIDSSYYYLQDHKSFSMESTDSISLVSQKSLSFISQDMGEAKKELSIDFLSQKIKKPGKYNTKRGFKEFNNDTEIDNKVAKFNEISSNDIISKLCSKNKYIRRKILQLKWLPTTFINPIQECRFMNYMFPLDSEMFKNNNNVVTNYYFKLEKIKRIISIEKNLKTSSYKLFMEDSNPQSASMYPQIRNTNIGYFKNWLMSLGNKRAIHFKEYLEMFEKKSKKIHVPFEIAENDVSYSNHQRENSKEDKYWVKKLNKSTVDWINKNPNMEKVYEIDRDTGLMELKHIGFDRRCLELIQVIPSLQDKRNGFLFTDRFKISDYYGIYIERFQAEMKEEYIYKLIETPEGFMKTRQYNNGGYCADINIGFFREQYIQNNRLYSKTIGVQLSTKLFN